MPLHPCKLKIGFIWSSTNQNEQNGTFVYQYPVAAARRQTSTFRRGCAIAELRPWLQNWKIKDFITITTHVTWGSLELTLVMRWPCPKQNRPREFAWKIEIISFHLFQTHYPGSNKFRSCWQNLLSLSKVQPCFSSALIHQLLADNLVAVVALKCSLETLQRLLVVVCCQKHLSCPVKKKLHHPHYRPAWHTCDGQASLWDPTQPIFWHPGTGDSIDKKKIIR